MQKLLILLTVLLHTTVSYSLVTTGNLRQIYVFGDSHASANFRCGQGPTVPGGTTCLHNDQKHLFKLFPFSGRTLCIV